MADSTPTPTAASDALSAARGDAGDKQEKRPRGPRGGNRNRATAGAGDATAAEHEGKEGKARGRKPKPKPTQPTPQATSEAVAAVAVTVSGESDANATTKVPRQPKQPRERKFNRKTDDHGKADVAPVAVPPPAPVSVPRDVNARVKKHDRKKQEAPVGGETKTASPVENKKAEDTTTQPRERRQKGKKKGGDDSTEPQDDGQEDEEGELVVTVDWSTAAWFSGCDADLGTGYWLLTRAYACNDVAVLENESLVRRAVVLQKLHARLKAELLPQDEPEDDGASEGKATPVTWTTPAILDAVVAAFPDDDTKKKTGGGGATSMVVSLLEGEVVDVATELLMCRAGRESLELLTRWEAHLASLLPQQLAARTDTSGNTEEKQDKSANADADDDASSADEDGDGPDADNAVGASDSVAVPVVPTTDGTDTATAADPVAAVVLPPPRQRKRKTVGSMNSAIAHAKAQVTAAIAFHRSYERHALGTADGSDATSATAVAQWTNEITSIYEATLVSPADEATRKSVAAQIQNAIRRSPHWRNHEVLLFGSSLSKFGAKTSDLDLCLRPTDVDPEETNTTMSVRELKLRMRRTQQEQDGSVLSNDATSRNDDAPFLKELLDKSHKTVEALANSVKKQRKKSANKSDLKLKRFVLLQAHWEAIVIALGFFYDKLVSGGAGTSANAQHAAKVAAAAYHAALHKQQKKRQKDIYAAAALLGRNGCHVDLVVAHARVPVIGFTHKASGFECDMCFDNYHACINTLLLRSYAECDDRARMLGIAIKHWAKRRGINDASLGYLSSYSFILLVIYFLQHRARLLPNLQHTELLRETNVPMMKLNGVDVSFCSDVTMAKAFHAAQQNKTSEQQVTGDAVSVGALLLAFFRFYSEEFDFSNHVVSVRHPEQAILKSTRWGRSKLKAWRFSIEDPLEMDRDLGSVLQFRCQQRIAEEMKRACKLLRDGHSFEVVVCEADPATKKSETAKKDAKKAKKEPQTKKPAGREAKKEGPKDKAHGDRNGVKVPAGGATTHAKDTTKTPRDAAARDAANETSKPPSSRERRANRLPTRDKAATADPNPSGQTRNARQPASGERPVRERGDRGGRRGRGSVDGRSQTKDAPSATPQPTAAS